MHFSPDKNSVPTELVNETIAIYGVELEEVNEAKFLGVLIDKDLAWKSYINKLWEKLRCNTGILNRVSKLSHLSSIRHYIIRYSKVTYVTILMYGVAPPTHFYETY